MTTRQNSPEADMYGQIHPIETPALIEIKLKELEMELNKLSATDKRGWDQANERCPNITNADHKLLFLRCEVFNVDLAARRLVKYWDKRIEIFGPIKAFLPLTLDQALKDDVVALSYGFIRVIKAEDPVGRGILFFDPSRQDATKYARESMVRALWYVIHARLEDQNAQKHGIVFLIYPRAAQFAQFDRALMRLNVESIKGCIPVRAAAFHICHPPRFFSVIFPIVRMFLGDRLKKRVKVYTGSDELVLEKLTVYGLTKDCVPSELGGNIILDHNAWIAERRSAAL